MESQSDTVIYLKDNSFIPDLANIQAEMGSAVFYNSDSMSHTIHCRGIRDLSELTIAPGKFVEITFPSPGRFEFSSTGYGLMKVINADTCGLFQ